MRAMRITAILFGSRAPSHEARDELVDEEAGVIGHDGNVIVAASRSIHAFIHAVDL